MLWLNSGWLAILNLVTDVHVRVNLNSFDNRPAKNVGKGDLATTGALEMVVDHRTVFPHQLHRHIADGGCGWDF